MDAFEFLCPLQQVSHLYCLTLLYKQDTCILQTRENPIGASHSSYLLSYTASENLKRCNRNSIKFYNLRVI